MTTHERPRVLHLFLAAIVSALLLSSCGSVSFTSSFSETIDGSGTVTTETIDVSAIEGLDICCDLDVVVEVVDGSEQLVELTVDDNLHDELRTTVNSDNVLKIEPRRNNVDLRPTGSIVLRTTGHEIDYLAGSSSSQVTATLADVDALTIKASSDSKLDVEAATNDLTIQSSSSSTVSGTFGGGGPLDINAGSDSDVNISFQADDVTIRASSSSKVAGDFGSGEWLDIDANSDSDVDITYETDDASINADSSSTVSLAGRATTVAIDANSDGRVLLTLAEVVDATIQGRSSASIELDASGTVEGSLSSDASLDVWGDAQIDVDTSSSASITRHN